MKNQRIIDMTKLTKFHTHELIRAVCPHAVTVWSEDVGEHQMTIPELKWAEEHKALQDEDPITYYEMLENVMRRSK
jgi:hypothetical protein